jgi:hypothetical protein
MAEKITLEIANDKYFYNPETGEIRSKKWLGKKIRPDTLVGSIRFHKNTGRTYRYIHSDKKLYLAHRLAWFMYYGTWPANQIDHINGDGLDNRICNLRDVTHAENGRNLKLKKNNTTGVCGVSFQANRYKAEIWFEGKKYHLGRFINLEDAALARAEAEKKFGFHKNHGKKR